MNICRKLKCQIKSLNNKWLPISKFSALTKEGLTIIIISN